MRPFVRHTPLEPSPWLSGLAAAAANGRGAGQDAAACASASAGQEHSPPAACPPQQPSAAAPCRVALKLESEQHTGSFKVRGALNKLLSLSPEAIAPGVFTASTGNHALAVLFAAAALSAAAREPDGSSSSSRKALAKLRSLGGHLVLHGNDCLQSETAAREAAAAAGAVYVSPYNDPWVMAGQGTVALELLTARRRGRLDAVLVPVGGGGLIGGVAAVLKAADPGIRVIGCQPAASCVMARSVAAGAVQPEYDCAADRDGDPDAAAAAAAAATEGTLSDATAGGVEYDSVTLQPCMDCVDEWVTVGEGEIAEAMADMLEHHSKLIEGAAGCAVAAFKRLAARLAGQWVVLVVCGGNVALPTLRRALDMARPEGAS
ncbi:hypothetical protein GPECTOR_480g416 [Gonium pectorale]|uniref:Tryptophan synthase beta chain-like PALP domain-containing protein n=1 Tax=Gonium pectorale TaxID=33097 RepID=A0A150FUY9_GONPE|nr:hypothetical protein GPECTOR_480g416 [Gonium pectorale]|eukprot:KXZ41417.1 hypothetical protein GPECTOR_480g416 [Gonium pectorale]